MAVAFGNAHGTYLTSPKLHYDLVDYAARVSGKPFVVHGASGLSEESLSMLFSIKGVRKINISTELKLAARQGFKIAEEKGFLDEAGFQPIKVQQILCDAIRNKAEDKMLMLRGN